MIVVTRKDIVDFIMSQPDDKPVDVAGNTINSECYCPMMEYAVQNNIPCTDAGVYTFWDKQKAVARLENGLAFSDFITSQKGLTYGQLKRKFS